MVVAVQHGRVDPRLAQHAPYRVPLAVDRGVDHPAVVGQVGEVDDRAGRGRVVGGQGHELRFAGDEDAGAQPVGHAQRAALHLVHERHVELAVGDHAQQGVGGDVHVQGGFLPVPAQAAQPAGQRAARGGAEAQLSAAEGGGAGLGDQGAQLGDERAGAAEHQPAQWGGTAARARADEQGTAQLLFDAPQLRAQRGLGHAELACGPVQAARVGDRAQCPEVPDLKLHVLGG